MMMMMMMWLFEENLFCNVTEEFRAWSVRCLRTTCAQTVHRKCILLAHVTLQH